MPNRTGLFLNRVFFLGFLGIEPSRLLFFCFFFTFSLRGAAEIFGFTSGTVVGNGEKKKKQNTAQKKRNQSGKSKKPKKKTTATKLCGRSRLRGFPPEIDSYRFNKVLLGFTGFVLVSFKFDWIGLDLIGFYRVLEGFIIFYLFLLIFTGFHWFLLGYSGFK